MERKNNEIWYHISQFKDIYWKESIENLKVFHKNKIINQSNNQTIKLKTVFEFEYKVDRLDYSSWNF